MQETFDWLYQRSKENRMKGIDLYKIILADNNILLAYRTIKSNTGAKTAGIDELTIEAFKNSTTEELIRKVRSKLHDYHPQAIRRIEIPKANGKKRPLGIPTMMDRLIQQMFKQVLEPICEAKFYSHNYGFRPNRSVHHAIARCSHLINKANYHYVVDVDIQSFFDKINHAKLTSQLYSIGIKDKRILAIIGKMLKSPVRQVGIPISGSVQGSILSPLLSNVVLNDLDNWISSQWEKFPSKHQYSKPDKKHYALRKSRLKEMYIVRYADDFKVFTKDYKQAWKIFHAIKGYLENHLKLNISPEKSKVTNLRKRSSEFLGFEIRAVKKRKKYVANTHVSKQNKKRIKQQVKKQLISIQKSPTYTNVSKYNSYVLGVHNYYSAATHVNVDFSQIAYSLLCTCYNRLKSIGKYEVPRSPPETYRKFYKNNYKTFKIGNIYLFPLGDIKWKKNYNFSQQICDYTEIGRAQSLTRLKEPVLNEIGRILYKKVDNSRIEYHDNRISRYSMQNGKCAITGWLLKAEEIHCHHVLPIFFGGTDEFRNLVIVHECVHKLIHASNKQTIEQYLRLLKLNGKQLEKLNIFRKMCNLANIY